MVKYILKSLRISQWIYTSAHFFFEQFIKGLIERYPEIFDGGISGDGLAAEAQANFARKWKSYSSIIQLAQGDITKIDEVVLQPLEKCLLYLAYEADKYQVEELVHKAAMRKAGVK